MIRLASIVLVAFFSLLSNYASASLLEGKTIAYAYYFPDYTITPPIFVDFDVTVGPGEEFPNLFGDPTGGRGTVDISDKNITIDFFADAPFTAAVFNGFRIVDINGTVDPFTSVAINAATNLVGFTAANILFDAENIYVNLQGLSFTTETLLSLDINGGNAPVPEPTTLLVWAGLGLATAGTIYSKRRRTAKTKHNTCSLAIG